jgi:hypothetical protein
MASSDRSTSTTVLLALTGAVMVLVVVVLSLGLWTQVRSYDRLIPALLTAPAPSTTALLAASRSLDAAVVKTCSLYVAFLLILLGGVYTLRVGEIAYKLSVGGGIGKGALQTASPGLVIVTLGALIVAVTILKEQTINLTADAVTTVGVPAADPAADRASSSVSTSTAVDADSRRQGDDLDVRTLTGVIAHLHTQSNARSLSESDVRDSMDLVKRLESMRLAIALRRFPDLAPRYAEFAKLHEQNREAEMQALSPRLAEQFRQVQALFGQQ